MTRHLKLRFIILFSSGLFLICAILYCRYRVIEDLQLQIYGNLSDVAQQNAIFMERELHSRHELLLNIAGNLVVSPENIDSERIISSVLDTLNTISNLYNSKRWGFITTDGIAYTTDGYMADLSIEDCYKYGMQGLSNITGSFTDTIGHTDAINVFSVPVYATDGSIAGVLFSTYLTKDFKEVLNVSSFNGVGYSYIIKADGTVITDSVKSPMYGTTNVLTSMLLASSNNKKIVSQLREDIKNEKTGYGTFTNVSKRYMHYTPLYVHTADQPWYLLTIVPANTLDAKIDGIMFYQNIAMLVIVIAMLIITLYFISTYKNDSTLLKKLAYEDPLTGGYNYQAFLKKIRSLSEHQGYMISIDINEFKLVNTLCGIEKGNEVLIAVWRVISRSLMDYEVAAHINADHYIMFLMAPSREKITERIISISNEISALSKRLNTVSLLAYFGIYETTSSADPEESYSRANQAKHLVRGNTKKNWAFFEEVDSQSVAEAKQIEDAFDEAIERREFELWYQPKYSAQTSQMSGAEALVRWRRPDGSLVPPGLFIPLFETNGMIITLDEYIFEAACMQQKFWKDRGHKPFPISVNISRASLHYTYIPKRYKGILDKYGIAPELVPLEITESATVNNSQIRSMINAFHDLGFVLHLDDFGNGYSSLSTLSLKHFNTLKLDKGLIDFIGDPTSEKLLIYTTQLAKSLGMHVTAEGVETESQVQFLKEICCDDIQGYYFSKPLPMAEFEKIL